MNTLQSYIVRTSIEDIFILVNLPHSGTWSGPISGQFFYLVWIENELESKRAESPFSKN